MPNRTREKARAYARKWRAKNRAKVNSYSTNWYRRHKDDPGFKEKHSRRYRTWREANPEGNRSRAKKYRTLNPKRFAAYQIRKNYNVSLEEAYSLLARKDKGCEICGSQIRVHIDHDHITGRIRGILCSGCNLAIGHAQEKPEVLRLLAAYLETTSAPISTSEVPDPSNHQVYPSEPDSHH